MIKRIKKIYKRYKAWLSWYPPGSLTASGWRLFDKEFKQNAPIRYWIKKDFRHEIILPIKWKYDAVCNWIRFRTYDKYHVVNTGLKPNYYDFDTRMLHVNFNMFRDFIECEKARLNWCTGKKQNVKWYQKLPFYWKFIEFRSPEDGLKYLEWEMTLDDPSLPPHEQSPEQAALAREQFVLYKWWTQDRPSREEESFVDYSDQGLGIMGVLDDDFDRNAADYLNAKKVIQKNNDLQDQWEKEDEEMLIRLVKIKGSLWT
jgi:hypothetical protein